MEDATIERCRPTRRVLLRGRLHDEPTLRPPWALDGSRFSDACTGCGDCVRACPPQVLVRGAGGLPVFEPAQGECTFCGECSAACPEPVFVSRNVTRFAHVAVVGDGCLARNDVACQSCGECCPEQAIRFRPRIGGPFLPGLNEEICSGCGACLSVCPVGAIGLRPGELEAADA